LEEYPPKLPREYFRRGEKWRKCFRCGNFASPTAQLFFSGEVYFCRGENGQNLYVPQRQYVCEQRKYFRWRRKCFRPGEIVIAAAKTGKIFR